jgi:hypothetical protein
MPIEGLLHGMPIPNVWRSSGPRQCFRLEGYAIKMLTLLSIKVLWIKSSPKMYALAAESVMVCMWQRNAGRIPHGPTWHPSLQQSLTATLQSIKSELDLHRQESITRTSNLLS